MKLNDKTYNATKWVAQILLPALGMFYFGLSDLWDLPNALKVVGTITLVDTFLGVLLGISSAKFNKETELAAKENEANGGVLLQNGVDPDTGIPNLGLVLNKLPQELLSKKTVTLHVDQSTVTPAPLLLDEEETPEV